MRIRRLQSRGSLHAWRKLRAAGRWLADHSAAGLDLARRVVRRSATDRITTNAASLAFHWFLAIFPGALALVGISHLLGLSAHDVQGLVHGVGVLLPAAASSVLVDALRSPSTARESILEVGFGALVALWASIEAMAALQVGLDVAFGVRRDRGLVSRRLAAMPLLAITVCIGGGAFALVVLGVPLGHLIEADLPFGRAAFTPAWDAVRFAGALILVSLLVAAYYRYGPWQERRTQRLVTPGSIAATIGWFAASGAYSYYLDDIGHASRTYGTFAGVAVLLLWLFVTGLMVLIGAEVDRELLRSRLDAS